MLLTVWGSRGSIPVSGPRAVRYGGDTTCLEVTARDGTTIVLDLGTGVRELGNSLMASASPPGRIHVLLTHAHWDHLQGFPFFRPLYSKSFELVFHGWREAQQGVQSLLRQAMQPPFFPVDLGAVAATLTFSEDTPEGFEIESVCVQRIPLNHPNGGCAFKICDGESCMAFFPDNELTHPHPGGRTRQEYVEFCRGVDVLVHDAEYLRDEYDGGTKGWGHSVLEDTVSLALDAGVKCLILWHHKPERSDDELDAMVEAARAQVEAAGSTMICEAAWTGMVVEL
jgi:phosphoribosyl 1,2-cyclic phosphodiesterase